MNKKVRIGDLFTIKRGRHQPLPLVEKYWDFENGYFWLRIADIKNLIDNTQKKLSKEGLEYPGKNYENFIFKKNSFVMARYGTIGKIGWLNKNMYASIALINFDCQNLILKKYLYYFFKKNNELIKKWKINTAIPSFRISKIENLEISLPTEERIQKITKTIINFNKLREINNKITEKINFLEESILLMRKNNEDTKKVRIGDLFTIKKGRHYPTTKNEKYWDHQNGFLWLRIGDIKPFIKNTSYKLSKLGIETIKNYQTFQFKKDSFVMAIDGNTIGKLGWLKDYFYASTHLVDFEYDNLIFKKYLYYYFLKNQKKLFNLRVGTVIPSIKLKKIENLKINFPTEERIQKITKTIINFNKLREINNKISEKINFLEESILSI